MYVAGVCSNLKTRSKLSNVGVILYRQQATKMISWHFSRVKCPKKSFNFFPNIKVRLYILSSTSSSKFSKSQFVTKIVKNLNFIAKDSNEKIAKKL